MSGHQILKVRKGRKRSVPGWAGDDTLFKNILMRAFPKLLTDKIQRERAGRWTRISYMYYKGNYTAQDISEEIGLSIEAVKFALVSMRRVAEGRWTNSKGKQRGLRPRGRPRNNGLSSSTPTGEEKQDPGVISEKM